MFPSVSPPYSTLLCLTCSLPSLFYPSFYTVCFSLHAFNFLSLPIPPVLLLNPHPKFLSPLPSHFHFYSIFPNTILSYLLLTHLTFRFSHPSSSHYSLFTSSCLYQITFLHCSFPYFAVFNSPTALSPSLPLPLPPLSSRGVRATR